MRISDEIVQQVRESNDIIDVLEEYLTFKRNGDNYLALCPFHQERNKFLNVLVVVKVVM